MSLLLFKHISTSVVVCSKIIYLRNSQYFSHTEVLIIKVYVHRKKVLLILPNSMCVCSFACTCVCTRVHVRGYVLSVCTHAFSGIGFLRM